MERLLYILLLFHYWDSSPASSVLVLYMARCIVFDIFALTRTIRTNEHEEEEEKKTKRRRKMQRHKAECIETDHHPCDPQPTNRSLENPSGKYLAIH